MKVNLQDLIISILYRVRKTREREKEGREATIKIVAYGVQLIVTTENNNPVANSCSSGTQKH